MTEPPSLDQSQHKSDLEPGALLHWAMCLHCLTQDPSTDLMTVDAVTKLIPRHWEAYLTPTNYTTHSSVFVSREHWSYSLYKQREKKKKKKPDNQSCLFKTPFIFFVSLVCLSKQLEFWERYFPHIKASACTAFVYNNSLIATAFQVIFAKYNHTFYDSVQTHASYDWAPGGIKASFYHSHPPCFHYLKRGCVHTSTRPSNFFLHCKHRHVDSVW